MQKFLFFLGVCLSVCMCVFVHSHTQAGLKYRPVYWPGHYHLDLCCLMLNQKCLIKGIMVVRLF